jgi:hypothetical protein
VIHRIRVFGMAAGAGVLLLSAYGLPDQDAPEAVSTDALIQSPVRSEFSLAARPA